MSSRQSSCFRLFACLILGLVCATAAWADTPEAATATSPQEATPAPAPSTAAPGARTTTGTPRLAVIGLDLDGASSYAAARLHHLGEELADGSGRFSLIDLIAHLDPDAAAESDATRARVEALLSESRAAYDELELALSRDKAVEAQDLLLKADLTRHFEQYVATQTLQIAALLADSEIQAADRLLARLLPMDLETQFDPDLFSPDYVAQVRKSREALAKEPPKGAALKVRPVSARVYIDGKFRGISPLELTDLVPGDHILTLIAPGYRRVQRTISPGTASAFDEVLEPTARQAEFQPLLDALRARFLDKARSDAAQTLASFLKADQLAVIGVRGQSGDNLRVTAIRVDARDGHEYAFIDELVPNDVTGFAASSQDLLGKMFAVDLPRDKGGRAVQARTNPFKWKMRHTSYVLFGVAAAALGGGIGFGVNASSQASAYADLDAPQNNPVYDRIETVGMRSAILADVSFGVALAAAATGTVLLIRDLVKKDSFGGQIEETVRVAAPVAVEEAPVAAPPPAAPIEQRRVESRQAEASGTDAEVVSSGRVSFSDSDDADKADDKKSTESVDDGWGDGW